MQKLQATDKFKVIKDDVQYEFEVAEEGGTSFRCPNFRVVFRRERTLKRPGG